MIASVQFSRSVVSDSLRPHGLEHARPPCPSPTPRVYSNSHPLSQWCYPTISSSVVLFSSHFHSFPTRRSSDLVVSDSLQPHGLQHARLPCASPTPRVYSNSCALSRWCNPTSSSCRPLLLLPSIFPSIRVFSNESALCIRWQKQVTNSNCSYKIHLKIIN